jgi:hypothetical protein
MPRPPSFSTGEVEFFIDSGRSWTVTELGSTMPGAETDLLGDIPENDPDAIYLAAKYADGAAGRRKEENDIRQ